MSICATHLSRLAEEIVIFASPDFGFLELPDAFSTGLVHHAAKTQSGCGGAGARQKRRIIGALTGLFIVMKGLPLAYSKDMQEDKEGVFNALDSLSLCLAAMTGMMEN